MHDVKHTCPGSKREGKFENNQVRGKRTRLKRMQKKTDGREEKNTKASALIGMMQHEKNTVLFWCCARQDTKSKCTPPPLLLIGYLTTKIDFT